MKSVFFDLFVSFFGGCVERLLIAGHNSVGIYNTGVFVVLCDEEEMRSCENEMQFAIKMEKDDVSVFLLIVHTPMSLLRLNVSLF